MVLFAGSNVLVGRVLAAEPAPSARWCVAAAYRQFDFWVGDWDVFDVGSSIPVAHARIDPILDGCVLREDCQGTDGHKGRSFTIYDAARKVWHQSWVTNRGELLEIEGKIENGEIILSGEDRAAGSLVRGTWKPQNGDVRETAVTSTDGGNTWTPWFDLVFRRKASAVGDAHTSADDIKARAALDFKPRSRFRVFHGERIMDDHKGNALDWQAEPLSECTFRRFPTPFAAWWFQ